MVKRLKEEGHSADAIHGDLRQSKRDRVINSFRKGLKRILIATDVAARGLDIPLIQHVINYDLPQIPEDYVHRVGRTARAGSEGSALTFLTPDDRLMWNSINKLIDPNFKILSSGPGKNSKNKRREKRSNNKKKEFRKMKRFKSKGRGKSFGRVRRDGKGKNEEKKDFNFNGKKKFFNNKKRKPSGYTNNPKYFGKKNSENLPLDDERKSFSFKGKRKFKSRKNRPKQFTFKKHNKKRKQF